MSTFILNPKAPVIIIDAELVGPTRTHTIRMIVDTGATFTMIHPEPLSLIGCNLASQTEHKRITTASGLEYVPFITLNGIKTLGQEKATSSFVLIPCLQNFPLKVCWVLIFCVISIFILIFLNIFLK
ncbi:MAG: retropepsin-like domain-containing protein [Chlamydiae bacterium]|nr:retropepsin-like domain-containing protein [Chlamydiota bacterium]MBI3265540.1 retropepsin-like domain-containing protein [Chlamydiota bacterium]